MSIKKLSLTSQIFISMIVGILFGFLFINNPNISSTYIKPIGNIFINLLKFIVVPIVLLSLVSGIVSMKDIKKVGAIGGKAFIYFIITTVIATILSTGVALSFKNVFPVFPASSANTINSQSISVLDTLINIFPSNFFLSLANSDMLQIIFISIALGMSILSIGEKAKNLVSLIDILNEVFNKIMMGIIKFSPVGIFCLMTDLVASNGTSVLGSLVVVILVVYLALILHALIVYTFTVKVFAKINPITFIKEMMPAIIFAFTSTSSLATLPFTKQCSKKLGASEECASFVLSLGASMHKDGAAIYMPIISVFIATCYGVTLTVPQLLSIAITSILMSFGCPAIPNGNPLVLSMVLSSAGVPAEGVGLVIGIDKLFDMGCTVINILGDAPAAIMLSKSNENKDTDKIKIK